MLWDPGEVPHTGFQEPIYESLSWNSAFIRLVTWRLCLHQWNLSIRALFFFPGKLVDKHLPPQFLQVKGSSCEEGELIVANAHSSWEAHGPLAQKRESRWDPQQTYYTWCWKGSFTNIHMGHGLVSWGFTGTELTVPYILPSANPVSTNWGGGGAQKCLYGTQTCLTITRIPL